MRIVDKAQKGVYIINCPACGSKLEAGCEDLTIVENKVCKYICPVCKKTRYISWSAMKSKIIYLNSDE